MNNSNNNVIGIEPIENSNNENNYINKTKINNSIEEQLLIDNSNSNFDLFEEDDVIFAKEKILIPEHEREYQEDIVYLTDLQNTLLKEVPINRQDNKYIQDQVYQRAEDLIKLRNFGKQIIDNGDNYYSVKNKYKDGLFTEQWIIPIILDKQKLYKKLESEQTILEENTELDKELHIAEFLCKICDENSFVLNDQKKYLENISELLDKLSRNQILYEKFYTELMDIIRPYSMLSTLDEKGGTQGYILDSKIDTSVLRYYNIKNSYWENRMTVAQLSTRCETSNTIFKEIKLMDKVYIPAEKINIIGFMVLPYATDSILNSPAVQDDHIGRVGKIGTITNISKATNAVITVVNHGLNNESKIFISRSNSLPSLNGRYNTRINILDKDSFTVGIDTSKGHGGNMGFLYGPLTLNFIEKEIVKKSGNYIVKGDNSNDKDKPIAYFFEKAKITKDDFDKIIDLVIPTVGEIVLHKLISGSTNRGIENIMKILSKYKLDINELTIEELIPLKNVMLTYNNEFKITTNTEREKNLSKIRKIPDKPQLSELFSDIYLMSEFVIKNYGKYPSLGLPSDNLLNRVEWVNGHKDNGSLYISYAFSDLILKKDFKSLEKHIKIINDTAKEQLKNLIAKNSSNEIVESSKCNKLKYNIKNINELKNINKSILEKGDIAILPVYINESGTEETHDFKSKIFEWNGKDWNEEHEVNYAPSMINLCELSGNSIDKVKLSDINCIYSELLCTSQQKYRYIIRENVLKTITSNLKDLENSIKTNELKNNITSRMNYIEKSFRLTAKELYDRSIDNLSFKPDNSILEETELNLSKNTFPLGSQLTTELKDFFNPNIYSISLEIIHKIQKVGNSELQKQLIYRLISLDGLLIDKFVFSKKYAHPLVCGHWWYMYWFENSENGDEKQSIFENMIGIYSDGGKSDFAKHICKTCGATIGNTKLDTSEGLDSSGDRLSTREVWGTVENDLKLKDNISFEQKKKLDNCHSPDIRKYLSTMGVSNDNLEMATKICDIIRTFSQKIGISLTFSDHISVIMAVLNINSGIVEYDKFTKIRKQQLLKKGRSHNIERLEQKGYFEKTYNQYINTKIYSSVAARMLISFQTATPQYLKRTGSSKCAFNGFIDKNGVEYMSCIINDLKVIDLKSDISLESIYEEINKSYTEFRKYNYVSDLYTKYEKFIKNSKLLSKISSNIDKIIDVDKLDKDYLGILAKADTNQMIVKRDHLFARMNYISKGMLALIAKAISQVKINDLISPGIEKSCCTELINNYTTYIKYLNNYVNGEISTYMDEAVLLHLYYQAFIRRGTYHRYILPIDRVYNTPNNPVTLNSTPEITEHIKKLKFQSFCNIGATTGEYHFFINRDDFDKERCIKCGQYLKDIKKTNYTSEQFESLLNEIKILNINYLPKKDNIKPLLKTELLKQESINHLSKERKKLVDNISSILGKNNDNNFKTKYLEILKKLGNMSNEYDFDIREACGSNNKIISAQNNNQSTKLQKVKTYFIEIRQYVSIISNNFTDFFTPYDITTMNENEGDLMQKDIFSYKEKLKKFIDKGYEKLFHSLVFNYSNKIIYELHGIADIYNCSWSSLKHESDFSLTNAADVMIYILYVQLNTFISQANFYKSKIKNASVIVADFIITVLDIINDREELLDISETELSYYKKSFTNERNADRSKLFENMTDADKTIIMKENNLDNEDEFDTSVYLTIENKEENIDTNDMNEMIEENAKNIIKNKTGEDANDAQVEAFKENFMKNQYEDNSEYNEELNIMDVGDDYGDMPQGTENEDINDYNEN